jgi:hypothetical protein
MYAKSNTNQNKKINLSKLFVLCFMTATFLNSGHAAIILENSDNANHNDGNLKAIENQPLAI